MMLLLLLLTECCVVSRLAAPPVQCPAPATNILLSSEADQCLGPGCGRQAEMLSGRAAGTAAGASD